MDTVITSERPICAAHVLVDGGKGVRFKVQTREGTAVEAFVVRHRGVIRAYLNRCGHVGVELDWDNGTFFDTGGEYIVCALHWACYNPHTGACVSGPCHGRGLTPVPVEERDNRVWLQPRWGFTLIDSNGE